MAPPRAHGNVLTNLHLRALQGNINVRKRHSAGQCRHHTLKYQTLHTKVGESYNETQSLMYPSKYLHGTRRYACWRTPESCTRARRELIVMYGTGTPQGSANTTRFIARVKYMESVPNLQLESPLQVHPQGTFASRRSDVHQHVHFDYITRYPINLWVHAHNRELHSAYIKGTKLNKTLHWR